MTLDACTTSPNSIYARHVVLLSDSITIRDYSSTMADSLEDEDRQVVPVAKPTSLVKDKGFYKVLVHPPAAFSIVVATRRLLQKY